MKLLGIQRRIFWRLKEGGIFKYKIVTDKRLAHQAATCARRLCLGRYGQEDAFSTFLTCPFFFAFVCFLNAVLRVVLESVESRLPKASSRVSASSSDSNEGAALLVCNIPGKFYKDVLTDRQSTFSQKTRTALFTQVRMLSLIHI